MGESLCWSCECSGAGGCSWDIAFEPVDGWTAIPTKIHVSADNTIDSYHVAACPLYRAMDLHGRSADALAGRPKFTDEQLERLIRGGFSQHDIARILGVHISTVSSRRLRLEARRRAKQNGNGRA